MQEAKRGDRVSINPKTRAYFFQTEGGIRLVAGGEETAVIPTTATDEHLKQINMAIANNHILFGWAEATVEMPDRDSDLRAMVNESGRNKIDEWIHSLRGAKGIKNEEKVKQINKLIEFEKVGKNRKSVIRTAENALDYIGGISPVTETEQEKIEIKITPTEQVTDEPEKSVEIK